MGEVLKESEKRKQSESFQKWKLTLNEELFSMPSQDFIQRSLKEKVKNSSLKAFINGYLNQIHKHQPYRSRINQWHLTTQFFFGNVFCVFVLLNKNVNFYSWKSF